MRRLALFAALLASVAAEGYTYKDFYTPDAWESPTLAGVAYYTDQYGVLKDFSYKLRPGENGSYTTDIEGADGQSADSAFWTAVEASVSAAEAMAEAKYAQAQTDAFAERLSKLLMTDGFEITDTDGNVAKVRVSAGSIGAALGEVSGSSAPISATIDKGLGGEPDGVSVVRDGAGRLALANLPAGGSGQGYFPFWTGTALDWADIADIFDDKSIGVEADGGSAASAKSYVSIKGWTSQGGCGERLSDLLTDPERESTRGEHEILCRFGGANGGKIHYLPIGDAILSGGADVDGASITTNAADGAASDGVASLYNFAEQEDYAIPYKYKGKLLWRTADAWADGTSVEFAQDGEGNSKLSVKGAKDYAGQHSGHYFGTSSDQSAALGWHELPNVTTNVVMGDEVTVSSTAGDHGQAQASGADVKVVGLKGWDYGYGGDPLFLANVGGALGYVQLNMSSNGVPCGCTNRWEALCDWIGDDAKVEGDGTLTLPDGAPKGWADGGSIDRTDDGKYQVKGWDSAGACAASVGGMLGDPDGSDAQTHLFLARKTDTGDLHYVPVGSVADRNAAIEVVGTSGSAVCTNRLTFASDENSDVRFVVTDEGNGNVKITVGVYYK